MKRIGVNLRNLRIQPDRPNGTTTLQGGGHSFSVGGMKFVVWLARAALAVVVCASANGCLPSGSGQSEEEKESHFQAGRSCLNSMNYKGAVEAFEKALKVNPDSASAHVELACLFDQKESDPRQQKQRLDE